jgi:hypothetical protein
VRPVDDDDDLVASAVAATAAASVKLVTDPPLALCAVIGAQAVAELSIAISCNNTTKWCHHTLLSLRHSMGEEEEGDP